MKPTETQAPEIRSDLDGSGLRVAVVASRFHAGITEQLVQSACDGLTAHRVLPERIEVHRVPGAFELPLAVRWILDLDRHDAVIALGCVVRGETDHNVYINEAVARSLNELGLQSRVPVVLGVLTTLDLDQAERRADPAFGGGKGHDCALAALDMVRLRGELRGGEKQSKELNAPENG